MHHTEHLQPALKWKYVLWEMRRFEVIGCKTSMHHTEHLQPALKWKYVLWEIRRFEVIGCKTSNLSCLFALVNSLGLLPITPDIKHS